MSVVRAAAVLAVVAFFVSGCSAQVSDLSDAGGNAGGGGGTVGGVGGGSGGGSGGGAGGGGGTAGCAVTCDPHASCEGSVCVCPAGFSNPNGDGTVCADIDECSNGTNDCGPNATCTNTEGSFTCACNSGYSGDGKTCVANAPCTPDGGSSCLPIATCVPSGQSYACQCPSGYFGDGQNACNDINECSNGTASCGANAACTNTQGGFTCTCNPGFGGDGGTCTDVDECASSPCSPLVTCNNTPGSYGCGACPSGYAGDGGSCADVDECQNGGCSPLVSCANTVGSFTCGACPSGYTGSGVTCADIDECASNPCAQGVVCTNLPGTFACGACPSGFTGDGGSCTDLNECAGEGTGNNCSQNASCTNTAGSFSCSCNTGYVGDGGACADRNECTTGGANCSPSATCTNTVGSFTCACNNGYAGDGGSCADLNECAGEGSGNNCNVNASCTNTPGSFSCSCNTGYVGDGGSCADRNECTTGLANCSANATCTNTVGSFTCACRSGYGGDGGTCTDFDECAGEGSGNNCNVNATCTNTPGAFRCSCSTGYSGDGGTCADINECTSGASNCAPTATCTNTVGSFSCACNSGYAGDGGSCADVDECAPGGGNNCDPRAACTNTTGSFSCTCPYPYSDGSGGTGRVCIDACTAGTDLCAPSATCSPTSSGYSCACASTEVGDGYLCEAKTSCAGNPTACGPNGTCASGLCSCNAGYAQSGGQCVNACFPGAFGQCPDDKWYGVAGSDLGPWPTRITAGASWGPGITGVNWVTNTFHGTSFAAGANGSIYAFAGVDGTPNYGFQSWAAQVRKFDGTNSTLMGGMYDLGWVDYQPLSIETDLADNPVVMFHQSTGYNIAAVCLKRWTGSAWTPYPGSPDGGGCLTAPAASFAEGDPDKSALAMTSTGYPVAAYTTKFGSGYTAAVRLEQYTPTGWQELAGSNAVDGGIGIASWGYVYSGIDVALDTNDRPVVTWVTPTFDVVARKWTGTDWQDLPAGSAAPDAGGLSNSVANSATPAIAMSSTGPVVAWDEGGEIYVRRYDGTSWVEVGTGSATGGGISGTTTASSTPDVAVLPSGDIVVAWVEALTGNQEVYAKRFNGVSWVEDGASATGGGISNDPYGASDVHLDVDAQGRPIVGWHNNAGFGSPGSQLYVKRLQNGAWVDPKASNAVGGGLSNDVPRSGAPQVVLDPSRRPIVAWTVGTNPQQIAVRRYADGGWNDLGNVAGYSPSLAMSAQGEPLLAYQTIDYPYEIHVDRYAGGSWQAFGYATDAGVSNSPTVQSSQPQLIVDAVGRPVVLWDEQIRPSLTGGYYDVAYLKRFENGAWNEVAGSATGFGVSPANTSIYAPHVASDPAGNPVVMWSQGSGGVVYPYVRPFNGTSWGSATTNFLNYLGTGLMVDSTGPIVLGHVNVTGPSSIGVFRSGPTWTKLGYSGTYLVNDGREGVIFPDRSGKPIIAYSTIATGWDVLTQRFDGTNWVPIGAGSNSGGGVSNSEGRSFTVAGAAKDNTVCLAWIENTPKGDDILLRCNFALP